MARHLGRAMLIKCDLARLVGRHNVVGVTGNPSIFEAVLSAGDDYDGQVAQLRLAGVDAAAAAEFITVGDVREACDQLSGVRRASTGRHGRVSLEVDPRAADNSDAMTRQAIRLDGLAKRPSRKDTEVNLWLDQPELAPAHLRGTAAIVMAVSAYEHFQVSLESPRWLALQRQGAQVQRLLWASTE